MLEEYISPTWEIEVGQWNIKKITSYDVYSSCINPIDLADIKIPLESKGEIQKGMTVNIKAGYREKGMWTVFSGKVHEVLPGKSSILRCKDKMADLKEKPIRCFFTEAVPQDVIKYCLNINGIQSFQLSGREFSKKPFTASGINAVEVIKEVNRTWNVNFVFYFDLQGRFFWGEVEESERYQRDIIPVLEYGRNIIEHRMNDEGEGILETIILPEISHSSKIKIIDPRFFAGEKLVEIKKLHLHHQQKKARMVLQWSPIAS
ncbi:MAG: hypothetical protein JJT76_12840 [Clostridiaceae bacterium]|nr:hypothetical protein [Clostridiaceae bacterium]